MDGDTLIGMVSVRHRLNAFLKQYGGHIGYEIRKSKHGQGYGTKMLGLALKKAKALGLKKVMITCDTDNIASRRVIEKNGGQCFRRSVKVKQQAKPISKFWIAL